MVKVIHQKPVIRNIVCSYRFPILGEQRIDLYSAFNSIKGNIKTKFYPESNVPYLYVWFEGLYFHVCPNGKVILIGLKSIESYENSSAILSDFWKNYLKKFVIEKELKE